MPIRIDAGLGGGDLQPQEPTKAQPQTPTPALILLAWGAMLVIVYPSGPNMTDKINATHGLLFVLGIPITGQETWNVSQEPVLIPEPKPAWKNTTLVSVETSYAGVLLSPASYFEVRFTDYYPFAAIRIVIGACFSADWSALLPYNTLKRAAMDYLSGQAPNHTIGNLSAVALSPDIDRGVVFMVLSAPIYGANAPGDVFVWVDALSASVDHATFWYYYGSGAGPAGLDPLFLRALIDAGFAAGSILAGVSIVRRRDGLRRAFFLVAAILGGIQKDESRGYFVRGQIYGYILANPGATYSTLLNSLRLANGVLSYHLWVLERDGLVKDRYHGARKSFYPSQQMAPAIEPAILSQIQADIYRFVESTPWISHKEIAQHLRITKRSASYHVKRLTSLGFLTVKGTGRRKRCAVARAESGSS